MRIDRWLPLCGIVFVALVVLTVVGSGSTPDATDSAAKVTSFYNTHSTREFVMAVLLAAATPFIVLFALSLASAAGSRERSSQWQIALLTGAGVVAAVFLMNALVHFALADAGNNGVGGSGIRAMNTLDNDDWIAFNGALGVMMLAAAGVLLTGIRSTPRWLAWCALPLGVALFIPFADFIALLLTGVWIIVQSLLLSLRRAEAASTVERSQTASAQA